MDDGGTRVWLDDEAAAGRFSGVALLWRSGRPVFEHAAGLAHRGLRVPLRTDSRFLVASVTKMITAVAALRLVETGRIALDTPIVEVLPPEHVPAAASPELTLHHLLCHRSGLTNYHDDDDETWASYVSCWDRVPTYRVREVSDMLPLFSELPARAAPDEEWRYGDVNYLVIGLLLEAVTGRRFHAVVADEVLGPAGMADAGFFALDLDPERLAVGYATSDRPAEQGRSNMYAVPAVGMPDGGLIATATDLARFFDALASGQLVGPATLAEMIEPRATIRDTDGLEAYGYGLELTVVDGRVTILGHAGGDPGVSAMTSWFVDDATSVIVLCNQDRGSWPAHQQVAAAAGLSDPRS